MQAAWIGAEEIVQLLLDHGAEINHQESYGYAALHWAVECEHMACIKTLLKNGANANLPDNNGEMVLMIAVLQGLEEMVQVLLDHGADVNYQNSFGGTALHAAASEGLENIARKLIEYGADTRLTMEDGKNAFLLAVAAKQKALMKLLIVHEECQRVLDEALLLLVFLDRNAQFSKMLIEKGANVENDRPGPSLLMYAVAVGDEDLLRVLLDHGANVNRQGANNGGTALMCAITFASESDDALLGSDGHMDALTAAKILIDYGADVNLESQSGKTALTMAISSNNVAMAQLLIDNGADCGAPVLFEAVAAGNEAIVGAMIEKGVDINDQDRNDGNTALHIAACKGRQAIARMLTDHGADVNIPNNDKATALMHALTFNHEAIARDFIDKGADVNLQDTKGRTALSHYCREISGAMGQLLKKHGARA